ncbi:zinc finger protein 32 [Amia ocellicauda]|uniref:zinc finger protein 32 n=1 Tax=Amia ocellicauda TaxID=2972642 RepID=UPI003464B770
MLLVEGFRQRLSSALGELARAALCEACGALAELLAEHRVEVTRWQRENRALKRRLRELQAARRCEGSRSSEADAQPQKSPGNGGLEQSCGEREPRGAAAGSVEASTLPDSGERTPTEQQHCKQEWGSSLRQDTEPTDTEDKQGLTEQSRGRRSEEELSGLESGHREEPKTEGSTPGRQTESIALGTELSEGSDRAGRGESPSTQCRPLHPRPSSSHTPPSQQIQKHQGRHCCSQCGKTFGNIGSLKEHLCIHPRKGLYFCSQCGKSFSVLGSLKSHQRIHTGEKPYCCSQCGKSFSSLGSHTDHQRIHTGEKPYCCAQCGKSFSKLGNLKRHQSIHSGVKPYCCAQCGKCFSVSGNLKSHQRIHTGEKPYCCSQCGKSFSNLGSFTYHKRFHTGETPC